MLHPIALYASLSLAEPAQASLIPQESLQDPRRTLVVKVVESAKPAVVSITSDIRMRSWFGYQDDQVAGTGVVIFEDGYIITNNHVVEGAHSIHVTFDETDDPNVYEGRVISQVPERDLALVKIEGAEPFHTVPLCEGEPILGETVIAIGNAFKHSHTVSTGIVSGLHRDIETREGEHFKNLIQTDASINPGNSGGPLLNIEGELIAINTARQGMAENIGFAIPVDEVRRVLSDELLSLSQASSWLGFDADPRTFAVTRVIPGGPAEQAGLQGGDRLRALAGHLLTNEEDYRRVRLSIQAGREVPITVKRGGGERKLQVPAWTQADGLVFERLGLALDVVRFGGRYDPYLRVLSVQPEGPAGQLGLRPGDVLRWIRQSGWRQPRWFQRVEDLAYLLSRLRPGTELTLQIGRDEDGDGIYFEETERYEGTLTLR